MVRNPLALGKTTVTFPVTALAEAGIPQKLLAICVNEVPPVIGTPGAEQAVCPDRVSSKRVGEDRG